MNRYEFENLISDYLDGSIPFKKRIEFEDYMKDDKDAEDLVSNIKTTISEMNNSQKVKVADNFNEKLLSRVKNEGIVSKPNNTILGFTPFYASILSCLCVAFFVVTSQLINVSQDSSSEIKTNQYTAELEQNNPSYSKSVDLEKKLIVDSNIDSLQDKKEKEKPNNSNKIKFVNY
jgi:anti-sigma-K factor RskA